MSDNHKAGATAHPLMACKISKIRSYVLICTLLGVFFTSFAYGSGGAKEILTPAERLWLTNNQSRIVLAVETGYAPFVFLDEKNQPTGLAQDYILLTESKLGVHFKQERFSSLDDIFKQVRSGKVHIVNAVTYTPARAKFLSMTPPFISVPNVIVVRKERSNKIVENELSGLKVSLVKSYAVTEHMTNRGLNIVPDFVPDDLSALLNVSFGRSDAAIIDLATASYLITQKGITNLRVAGEIPFDIRLSIATPLDEPMLHGILQKGLNEITDAERQEIKKRWINTSQYQNIFKEQQFWLILGGVLAVAFTLFTIILAWNRTLQRQIALRKKAEEALQALNDTLEKRVKEEVAKNMAQERLLIQQSRLAAMGEMIGNIAHQWRQPINALTLLLANIKDANDYHELDTAMIDESTAKGQELIQKMSTTIDDFRNFFKPNREKQSFQPWNGIEDAIKLVNESFKLNGIEIDLDKSGGPCEVMGYPNEFSQVVLNALSNAKEAIIEKKAHGKVHIRVEKRADIAAVAICDNGGGIPAEILDKVFDPYFTTKEKGTGIGLYMSKMIMDHMDGDIVIRNIEGGAEVLITLPLAPNR